MAVQWLKLHVSNARGTGNQSLVSELRAHMSYGMAKKIFFNVKGCSFVFSGREESYKSVLFIFLPFAMRLPFPAFKDIIS